MAEFSMASMTDVIFLLLVFFMVTSTYVFPAAIEVHLPEGSEQTAEKPSTRIFVDSIGSYHVSFDDAELVPIERDSLGSVLSQYNALFPDKGFAVYADTRVEYGKVVEVLNIGAENSLKMVLATRPTQKASRPTAQAPANE